MSTNPDNKFQRVEEDSPDRCQAIVSAGQCPYKKLPGLDFCPMHKGNGSASLEKRNMRNYRLGQWQARMEEFADNDQVKSLREEVGICRMMLEQYVNQCHNETDMILYSNKISELVMKIDKLVVSCHKMEQSTGLLLDKGQVMHLADLFVAIIDKHIHDADISASISAEIASELMKIQGTSK